MTNANETVRYLGTTDEVETCDCCGKSNLKVTVALLFPQADEPVYFGTTCAAHALSRPAKEIRKAAKSMDDAHSAAIAEDFRRKQDAEFKREQAIFDRLVPQHRGERFLQIMALGGHEKCWDVIAANA